MAAKTTLNAKNLQALGAETLADLVMSLVDGNAALKREARAALLELAGDGAMAAEVRKRLVSIKKARSFVNWKKKKAFATELTRLHRTIADKIAPQNPKEALELIWLFLGLAPSVYERLGDSNGMIGEIFHNACADIGAIATRAKSDPVKLAGQVFRALMDSNHYAEFDGLLASTAQTLGDKGIAHLKALFTEAAAKPEKPKKTRKEDVIGWSTRGAVYRQDIERGHRESTIRRSLMEIADIQQDVDGFIAQLDENARKLDLNAADIAMRLVKANRASEALKFLDEAHQDERFFHADWIDARLTTLEALDRTDEAQAMRWSLFERSFSDDYLRDYLKKLPDFEDIEVEEKAFAHVSASKDVHRALEFFIKWPALDRAAKLIEDRHDALNGDLYFLLSPAADALLDKHPRAATLLLRALIDDTLAGGKSGRYKHAATHLMDCDSLAGAIDDFGPFETHEAFDARIRAKHGRKYAFWTLIK